jgi:hypothetical protein
MNPLKRNLCYGLVALCVGGMMSASSAQDAEPKNKKPGNVALERTRDTVKMLDDVYKTAVVLITTHYVNDKDDLPAGTAAIALFDAINKKGWHTVRLIDASGEPINDANVAEDEFEKEAIAKLKAGESWHESVVRKDGKRILRAMTPIPVVLEKCTMCHENYKQFKDGQPIGALSYTIPVR